MSLLQDLAKRLLKGAMTDEVADLALQRATDLQRGTGKTLHLTVEVTEGPRELVGKRVGLKVMQFERK